MLKAGKRPAVLRKIAALLFATIFLLFGAAGQALAATGSDLQEIRSLLKDSYITAVPANVLQAQNIDQTLSLLGDPYTAYFTKSEYQDFLDSLQNQISGIGVHMSMVAQGVEVVSVIADSPAEKAGLQSGDIITRADQHPLGGLTADQATALLRGPAETSVNLGVLRRSKFLFLSLTRQVLAQPEISSELLDGHIGYLQINVFSSDTAEVFGKQASALKDKGADSWIIDLRDNPGGYLDAAVKLAGYFIPDRLVVQVEDRSGYLNSIVAPPQDFQVKGSVFVLTNQNSASASEILSAALKDQKAATIIGSKTFGKGSVQGMYKLSDGSVLKMTIAHFYSPIGSAINHVGVMPDIEVDPGYAKEEAQLLLNGNQIGPKTNGVRIYYNDQVYTVPFDKALTEQNWPAWQNLVSSLAGKARFQVNSSGSWSLVSGADAAKLYPLSYSGYADGGVIDSPPLDKKFMLTFSAPVSAKQISATDIELIDLASGEPLAVTYQQLENNRILVIPKNQLQAGKDYWLVVNPSLREESGKNIEQGRVTRIRT